MRLLEFLNGKIFETYLDKLELKNNRIYIPLEKIFYRVKPYFPKNFINYYEKLLFYSYFIKKKDLCFDIGASKGDYTRHYLKLGAKVICVEPLKNCIKKLYNFFGKNKNVIIIEKAVGDKNYNKEISICEEADYLSSFSEKFITKSQFTRRYHWTKKQSVELITIDSLIEKYGLPKFCKIDVEGFEATVFKGLTKKIPYISFEFHREFFEETKKCIDYILTLGYAKFFFISSFEKQWNIKRWVSHTRLIKDILSFKNDKFWGDIYVKFL